MIVPKHRSTPPAKRHRRVLSAALWLLPATLLGCQYTGGVENPVARKFTWFSYVGGDDIRRSCTPSSQPQYRLVYNAHWQEQVRAYDLRRSATGEGAMLWSHVFGGYQAIGNFTLDDPTAPWRGPSSSTRL